LSASTTTSAIASAWQLVHSLGQLRCGALAARVDVEQPAIGLHELSLNGVPIDGRLLGVTVAEEGAPPTELATAGIDKFVRDGDLVANYPQCETQPFTLHNYWRIAAASEKLVVIDAIVSLQTTLLECYPKTILTTELPAKEALLVSPTETAERRIKSTLEGGEPVGILLRGVHPAWSYVEITHPTDLGTWRIASNATTRMQRELGGEFQEKGVIRRLRVRGAFVAAVNDRELARRAISDFIASEPPLTA
jgi:hypothetical protein